MSHHEVLLTPGRARSFPAKDEVDLAMWGVQTQTIVAVLGAVLGLVAIGFVTV